MKDWNTIAYLRTWFHQADAALLSGRISPSEYSSAVLEIVRLAWATSTSREILA